MRKVWLFLLATMFTAATVNAGPILLSATINGSDYCASDNNVGCGFGTVIVDIDPTFGRLELGNVILGGIEFTGSAQQATFGPTQNILNTSFLQATNNTGGTVTGRVAISATDFIPPVTSASISGAATWQNAVGSTADLFWFNDPSNNLGAENPDDRPGLMLASFSDLATEIADSFNYSQNGIPVLDMSPFSMTLATNFSIVNGAQLTNRGMTEIKPIDAAPVPEPASLFLLGSGILAAARYRKKLGIKA